MDTKEVDEDSFCLLCCNLITVFAIGVCDHANICFACTRKLREQIKTKQCPICKVIKFNKSLNSYRHSWKRLYLAHKSGVLVNMKI